MKKKVLSILIIVGIMTIPKVVQANERISANRICKQDTYETLVSMDDKLSSFIYKNLYPQINKYLCDEQKKLQILCKAILLNNKVNISISDFRNYSYSMLGKQVEFNNQCFNNIKLDETRKNDTLKNIVSDENIKLNKSDKEESKVQISSQVKPESNIDTKKTKTIVQNKQDNKVKSEVNVTENKDRKLQLDYKNAVNKKMVELINKLRATKGVESLKSVDTLNDLAEKRSQYMAQTGEFSHNDKYGNFIFKDELNKINYKWNNVGENIAQNYYFEDPNKLAEELFTQWKNSPGHYQNMINQTFNEIGFGIGMSSDGKVYATQGFVGKK